MPIPNTKSNSQKARALASASALGLVPRELATLELLTVAELSQKYRALYGEPTRSRNKEYLQKRLAWKIQERAQGGLPPSALAKIQELGDGLPERWRRLEAVRAGEDHRTEGAPEPASEAKTEPLPAPSLAPPLLEGPRDPRLPRVGSKLSRVWAGKTHQVQVTADGFECAGEQFRTLSGVAKHITGKPWNGFLFFGLKARGEPAPAKQAAR